ncbi:YitT family protein [Aestuariibacter salexigens]|uniref:YitT family protein n=1 Tax=Aestuariibacter salexigens TaxID=226010 RepID=UPI00040BCDA8|nr:YitT family protein [Aestuariibacter salexigens]
MNSPKHHLYEDLLALLCGSIFVALGVYLFNAQGLLIGGAAGIALLGTHLSELSFGALFFLINLPFYTLALTQLGKRFTLNTFISVSVVSVFSEYIGHFIDINDIHPLFAAVVGGLLIGTGILIMFRHKSSLGGVGVLGLWIQNKFGYRAGNVTLGIDITILAVSLFFILLELILYSIAGAVALNVVIAVNHRPERYKVVQITAADVSDSETSSALKPVNGLCKQA